MTRATLKQAAKILTLFGDTPSDKVQSILASGLLTDLRDGNIGKVNRDAFRRLLGLAPLSQQAERVFPVWKTIRLGTGLLTADDFRSALEHRGFRIGDWANNILGKPAFMVATEERKVDLVVVSVAELGFKNGAPRRDIYKRALKLGLELCPHEVGPQLRLQYKDQPMGEWLLVGMKPITGLDGYPDVFRVEHTDDGLWLNGSYNNPGRIWSDDYRWVFVRRPVAVR